MNDVAPKTRKGRIKGPLPEDIHIGNRVHARRIMMGISQTKLGEGLGITFQQIQKYEKGLNRIGGSKLSHIARILKVPVAFFFEGLESDTFSEEHPLAFPSDKYTLDVLQAFATLANEQKRALRDLVVAIANQQSGK